MSQKYQEKNDFREFVNAFFICTACICILEGVLGMIFLPDVSMDYGAFFSPPLFGFFSALFGLVNYSKKELSVKQVIFRKCIHLLLIEGMVFGLNFLEGVTFPPFMAVVLALSIALIFFLVHWLMYLNEKKSAEQFNAELRKFKEGPL